MKFDRKKFFNGFRSTFDSTIEQKQVDGLNFLLDKMEADPFWKVLPQIAYAFSTVYHETAGSFQPVEEGYYLGRKAKAFQKGLRYYPYFGRGFIQLTHKSNYEKAGRVFGVDLVNKPQLALDPEIAYKILTYGMHQGWFTGKKLSDYISDTGKDYKSARRIVNGLDRAALIAGYARQFEEILRASKLAAAPATESSKGTGTDTVDSNTTNSNSANQPPPMQPSQPSTAPASIAAQPDANREQNVVVVREERLGFWSTLWKKFAAAFATLGGWTGVSTTAQQAQAFGLSQQVWERLFYVIAAGIILFIISEIVRWFFVKWMKRKRTEALVNANSTPNNSVTVIRPEEVPAYSAAGWVVIQRS